MTTKANNMETPVLLILFNRPFETRKLITSLKKVKPTLLYIFCDGPRNEMEKNLVLEVRNLVSELVDWPCEIRTLYSDENMGCREGVTNAINWVLNLENYTIILEDDCIPNEDFFEFVTAMLIRYQEDTDILMVSGRNELGEWKGVGADYFFTLGGIWGWGTWRRAWKEYANFDYYWNLGLGDYKKSKRYSSVYREVQSIERGCLLAISGKIDTWDYQWAYVRLFLNGLSINPRVNLVNNIGFNKNATHTKVSWKKEPTVGSLKPPYIPNSSKSIEYRYQRKIREKKFLVVIYRTLYKIKNQFKVHIVD